MYCRFAMLLLCFSVIAGCTNAEESSPTPVVEASAPLDVKSMSEEEQKTALAKAQAEHDSASRVFSDLNGLRYEIQVEIGKAKDAGFSGSSALIELRKLLKDVDVEVANIQAVTVESMKVIRQLQKIESAPMVTPKN